MLKALTACVVPLLAAATVIGGHDGVLDAVEVLPAGSLMRRMPSSRSWSLDVAAESIATGSPASFSANAANVQSDASVHDQRRASLRSWQACFQSNTRYVPLDMAGQYRTMETNISSCQARCRAVVGCAHFSFWPDGRCHLQDSAAVVEGTLNVTAGPPSCGITHGCLVSDKRYVPLDMAGQNRSLETNISSCQARCAGVAGCAHFSFWPDGGCHLQDSSASAESASGVTAGPPYCKVQDVDPGSQGWCFEDNTIYVPGSLRDNQTAVAKDLWDCRARCQSSASCARFSFRANGTCYMLDNGATPRREANVTSGPVSCQKDAGLANTIANTSNTSNTSNSSNTSKTGNNSNSSNSPSTPTAAPVPKCEDSVETGIIFKDGRKAFCSDLANYCYDTNLGAKVRESCTKTCGLCDIERASPDGCADGETTAPPTFELSGQLADCHALKLFCDTDVDIFSKCKLTCGRCKGAGTSQEVSNATTTSPFNTSWDAAKQATSCRRRRQMGFCSTRRRRL